MFSYLQTAFLNQWNLLFFSGGLAFAAVSGRFDVVAPLVLAAELAYLGFLGTNPTFQKYVQVQSGKSRQSASEGRQAYQLSRRILAELPKRDVDRFNLLRDRCEELRQLARQMQGSTGDPPPGVLDDFQIEGLDRLLWMYLKMLYTRYSVDKFLKQTNAAGIQRDIDETTSRLEALQGRDDDPLTERRRKLLQENLETSRTRLENHRRSGENYELMELEIQRLENTIHSLGELAVTRSEPKALSDQIDLMAESMIQTERALGDLQFATGLDLHEEQVPQLLRSPVVFEK